MTKYQVTGMMCAACSARVERAVKKVEGVTQVNVSLLTNSMLVEGEVSPKAVIKAVKKAGYGADVLREGETGRTLEVPEEEFRHLRKLFIISLFLLLPLMYLSMGKMLFHGPLTAFLSSRPLFSGSLQALLSLSLLLIHSRFFVNGFKGAVHGAANMDTLVALGAGVSFCYSLVLLLGAFRLPAASLFSDTEVPHLYFESAGMIPSLITFGKMLEAYSKGKTTSALKGLIRLQPSTAHVVRDGVETEIPLTELKVGDTFLVRPGESVPADGTVLSGDSPVNESALTGEALPVDKAAGSAVSAGTINTTGFLLCRADQVGKGTLLSGIIDTVAEASLTKAPAERIADKVSAVFVPAVIGISIVTFVIWRLTGADMSTALTYGVSVLVVSCPCALGLATPVAIMAGNGLAARKGILFKTAAALESMGKAGVIALDKTGTLTEGEMRVSDVWTEEGFADLSDSSLSDPVFALLTAARALEKNSEHPLAKAVLRFTEAHHLGEPMTTDFRVLPGNGLSGLFAAHENAPAIELTGGKKDYISTQCELSESCLEAYDKLTGEGKTVLFFAAEDRLLGFLAVTDTLRAETAEVIRDLKAMELEPVMISGDSKAAAQEMGRQAGIEKVFAEVLPQEKSDTVISLRGKKPVIMAGDGINDAPALTAADIGMGLGGGTDIAISAADVVLLKNDLRDIPRALRISRAVNLNIKENLFWDFFYNVLMIPLAAGAWSSFGLQMSPMLSAACMSLSSFCVCMNALRLNLLKVD